MNNNINTPEEKTARGEIYTEYSASGDMTFILIDKFKENGDVASTQVVGFYFGTPNTADTMQYIGKLKAEY